MPIIVVLAAAVIVVSVLLATVVAFKSIPDITSSAVPKRDRPQDPQTTP